MALSNLLLAGIQILAGGILLLTGAGAGLGVKLLLSGALTLISSFLQPKTGGSGRASSPTYGLSGLAGQEGEGSPVRVTYGEMKIQPSPISSNVKMSSDRQVYYLLYLIGHGEIEAINDIRINDVPIASFPDVVATTRLGTSDQTAIADFNQTGIAYPGGTTLSGSSGSTPGGSHVHVMRAAADELVIELVFQSGIFLTKDNGGLGNTTASFRVEYKASSSADSQYKAFVCASDEVDGWKYVTGRAAGTWSTDGKTQATYRKVMRLRFDNTKSRPARGQYTIRITCDDEQKSDRQRTATVDEVFEITNDGRAYAGLALLGLKMPATEQLSGSRPKVTCVVKGRKVYDPRTGLTAWSQNPVLCVRDLILSTDYGLGAYYSSTDVDDGVGSTFRAMADVCDATVTAPGASAAEARYQLDYVLDVKAPASDHIETMLQTCRMTAYAVDGLIKVAQDTTGVSIRSFENRLSASAATRRNILDDGSGKSTLVMRRLEADSSVNVVRVEYIDRLRGYERRTIEIRDAAASVGAITGTFQAGEKVTFASGGSKAYGRITGSFVNGDATITYQQDDGATAPASGWTVTGATSGATCTLTSAPGRLTPERTLDVSVDGVTRRSQAIREARYRLQLAQRRPLFFTWGVGPGDIDLVPGDVVDVSADHLPIASKKMTVLSCSFDADGVGVVEAREYSTDTFIDGVDTAVVDTLTWLPGGAVPPGTRTPADSAPAASGGSTSTSTPTTTPSSGSSFGSAGSGSSSSFFGASSGVTTLPTITISASGWAK